jgi:uncharacterized protein YjdB
MNTNLLKKLGLSVTLLAALTACSEDDGTVELFPDDLQPVSVSQTELTFEIDEGETFTFDFMQGVTNPENTNVFIRDFEFLEFARDDDGIQIQDQPLFVGPNLPSRAFTATENSGYFDGEVFTDALVHPFTATQRAETIARIEAENAARETANNADDDPSNDVALEDVPAVLYSQGVYSFIYFIDNGADTNVERRVTITVNGIEDPVESVSLSATTLSVPLEFPVRLFATVLPFNATFQAITWTSSDTDYATVDSMGVVTGLEAGIGQAVTITGTSQDGLQMAEATVNVIENPTEPVALDIRQGQDVFTAGTLDLPNGDTMQLEGRFVPFGLFEDDFSVTWESSDITVIDVDEDGAITAALGVAVGDSAVITASITELPDISVNVTVTVTDAANLLFTNGDHSFEQSEIGEFVDNDNWGPQWDNAGTLEVLEEAASEGSVGAKLTVVDGNAKLITAVGSIDLQEFNVNKLYRLSFDAKQVSGTDGAWRGGPLSMYSNSDGFKWTGQRWWGFANDAWNRQVIDFTGESLINSGMDASALQIEFFIRTGGAVYYIDNVSFVEMDPE